MGYYLADGIYPQWPVFLKTIRCPLGDRRRYFARAQESARKDVERAFGVLQSRFALVKGPTRFFYQGEIADIMYACIIMHNMIIEDEHEGVLDVTNDPSVASSSHGVSTESARQGVPHNEHERFQAFMDIHQKEAIKHYNTISSKNFYMLKVIEALVDEFSEFLFSLNKP
ncbi:uncharacterized protein LOC125194553 [Salvia hispanica]|uniref:uncharacterized protein LOC125194553 n=1 Tax=Salvia hispanica TaxID=49212 RepID=UPI0020095365|nr:uncharacterized protein LOC125194553 [Salvia hispanica]